MYDTPSVSLFHSVGRFKLVGRGTLTVLLTMGLSSQMFREGGLHLWIGYFLPEHPNRGLVHDDESRRMGRGLDANSVS